MRLRDNRTVLALSSILLFGTLGMAREKEKDGKGSKDAAYRSGYDYGYRDGLRHGRDDQRSGIRYKDKTKEYDKAERDSMEHKGDYKKGYREGYKAGYREGYGGRGRATDRYPDRYPYPDSRYPDRTSRTGNVFGSDRGYRDGLDKGRADRDRNLSYDPNRHDEYRDGDRGYRSSDGDRGKYRDGYRQGFKNGYDNGYRGTSGSGDIRYPRPF